MKHSAPQTSKFKKLKRRLGLAKNRDVIGILEALWHAAQFNAPRGNIGVLDDEELAIELEWDGEPEELIQALVDTRWLDRCTEHRLIVHGWCEHAPRYIHGIASKKGGMIEKAVTVDDYSAGLQSPTTVPDVVGNAKDVANSVKGVNADAQNAKSPDYSPGLQSTTTVDDYSRQQPNLTKPNLYKSVSQNGNGAAKPIDPMAAAYPDQGVDFSAFADAYPRQGRELGNVAKKRFAEAVSEIAARESKPASEACTWLVGRAKSYAASGKVSDGMVMSMKNWLAEGAYDHPDDRWESQKPPPQQKLKGMADPDFDPYQD